MPTGATPIEPPARRQRTGGLGSSRPGYTVSQATADFISGMQEIANMQALGYMFPTSMPNAIRGLPQPERDRWAIENQEL